MTGWVAGLVSGLNDRWVECGWMESFSPCLCWWMGRNPGCRGRQRPESPFQAYGTFWNILEIPVPDIQSIAVHGNIPGVTRIPASPRVPLTLSHPSLGWPGSVPGGTAGPSWAPRPLRDFPDSVASPILQTQLLHLEQLRGYLSSTAGQGCGSSWPQVDMARLVRAF